MILFYVFEQNSKEQIKQHEVPYHYQKQEVYNGIVAVLSCCLLHDLDPGASDANEDCKDCLKQRVKGESSAICGGISILVILSIVSEQLLAH